MGKRSESHGRAKGVLVAFVVVAGCGSSGTSPDSPSDAATSPVTDISGWFRVTSDLEGTCGAPTASSLGPAYVWVERRQDTFVVHACGGTTAADCTGTLFYDFTKPIANGMAAEGGSAFYSAGCTLSYERAEAVLLGNDWQATSLRYSTNRDLPQEQCTLAAASALTAPCTFEVDLSATRL
jgi:hypothetical protein